MVESSREHTSLSFSLCGLMKRIVREPLTRVLFSTKVSTTSFE